MALVFSVSAFFIVLREVLEACLVVGIVLAYLNKCGATHMKKWVWLGAGIGVGLSLALGIAFAIVFHVSGSQIFSDRAEKIFEGIIFLVAAGLLSTMIIWLMLVGKSFQKRMEAQVDQALAKGGKWSIFLLVGVQVLREGIETFIFVLGAANADEEGGWRAIPIPFILAVVVGIFLSYLLFKGLLSLNIGAFFLWSSILLMAFCAGLVSHAFHEFQEVDWLGPFEGTPSSERDWWNAVLFNISECCSDGSNQFFGMLRALFGYQDKPTFIEVITYAAYWLAIMGIFVGIYWKNILGARNRIARVTKTMALITAAFFLVNFIYAVSNPTWNGVLTSSLGLIFSVLALLSVFDIIFTHFSIVKPYRRTVCWVAALGFDTLAALMFSIILAHIICEEKECRLPLFYYWLFIFSEDWSEGEKLDTSFVSLTLLTISFLITIFLLGTFCFAITLFATNVTPDGDYLYEEKAQKVLADDPEEPLSSDDPENSAEPPAEPPAKAPVEVSA